MAWSGVCDWNFRLNFFSFFHYFGGQSIYTPSWRVIAFKSVAICKPCKFHDWNPSTSFATQPILFILYLHHFVAERTLQKVEVQRIHAYQFWQQHSLQGLFSRKWISKHKAASFWCMSVQITINVDLLPIWLRLDSFLDTEYGGLFYRTRI